MKKMRLALSALIMTAFISVPVFGEITVPDNVKNMNPVEAYKKGFEDGQKENGSKKTKNQDISPDKVLNNPIDVGSYEITITSIEMKKETISIKYNFKNKSNETVSPMMAGKFTIFQDGVELDENSENYEDYIRVMKNVKKGGEIKDVVRVFNTDSESKKFSAELSDFINFDNTDIIEFDLDVK